MEDKVIDRIRKLLALGRNNPNENEAALALERAHRLLAKYNLDINSVDSKEEDPYTRSDIPQPKSRTVAAKWVVNGIGKLYFCKVFASGDKFAFVGRGTNVAVAQAVYESVMHTLTITMRAELARVKLEHTHVTPSGMRVCMFDQDSSFKTNFMQHAANRVFRRCEQMIKDAEAGTTKDETGTALALASVYAAEASACAVFIQKQGVYLSKGTDRARGGATHAGKAEGAAAGNSVALRPQVSRSAQAIGFGG